MDIQKLKSIGSDRRVILTVVSAGSLAAGFALGYSRARSALEAQYELQMQQETAEIKRYYAAQRVVQEIKPSPEELLAKHHSEEAEAAREAMESYQGTTSGEHLVEHPPVKGSSIVTPEGKVVTELPETLVDDTDPETAAALQETVEGRTRDNVFAGRAPVEDEAEWDYAHEQAIRDANPDEPFIIHHDEYFENETEYEQGTLTYYEGDDTLVDDKDMPVPDESSVVGDDALTAFGHGSKDKNVVYVRNYSLEMDFEIVRSNGKFSVEVLGFDDEEGESLQHAHSRPNRRFRMEHDD